MDYNALSMEQKAFINACRTGRNVLVDACIGSGKTTAIQALCQMPWMISKSVLYLTYNKLLKEDARNKIHMPFVQVTNYHGYAYGSLIRNGTRVNFGDCIREFNHMPLVLPRIDCLIIDEYQDIEQEMADMLEILKARNPGMQIIAVGDMAQKIYDRTVLEAYSFIQDYLGGNVDVHEFTLCFRLNKAWAEKLGNIWNKTIIGVNHGQTVEYMRFEQARDYLLTLQPKDILCLGSNNGLRNVMLNELEQADSMKFNKNTCWAKITDTEGGATSPSQTSAVFTTYDGSKGMEREVCVLFDWTEEYWNSRIHKPGTKYEILRNIFCVAASRGKGKLIIIEDGKSTPLSDETLSTPTRYKVKMQDVQISNMFEHKHNEQIEAAYEALSVKTVQAPGQVIDVPTKDGLIDMSPCIGIYQETVYFENCDINRYIEIARENNKGSLLQAANWDKWPLNYQIAYLTALETNQNRYVNQTRMPIVTDMQSRQIMDRLATLLPRDAKAQVRCIQQFYKSGAIDFLAKGVADVIDADNTVIELKFVDALSHVHALQCAMYMLAMYRTRGLLWNVRTDERLEIKIPDRKNFVKLVGVAATKGANGYTGPSKSKQLKLFYGMYQKDCKEILKACSLSQIKESGIKAAFAQRGLWLPVSGREFVDAAIDGKLK